MNNNFFLKKLLQHGFLPDPSPKRTYFFSVLCKIKLLFIIFAQELSLSQTQMSWIGFKNAHSDLALTPNIADRLEHTKRHKPQWWKQMAHRGMLARFKTYKELTHTNKFGQCCLNIWERYLTHPISGSFHTSHFINLRGTDSLGSQGGKMLVFFR